MAYERGLKSGDVILSIIDNYASQSHKDISSPIEIINKIKQLKKDKKKILLLYIKHFKGFRGYVPLKINN